MRCLSFMMRMQEGQFTNEKDNTINRVCPDWIQLNSSDRDRMEAYPQ